MLARPPHSSRPLRIASQDRANVLISRKRKNAAPTVRRGLFGCPLVREPISISSASGSRFCGKFDRAPVKESFEPLAHGRAQGRRILHLGRQCTTRRLFPCNQFLLPRASAPNAHLRWRDISDQHLPRSPFDIVATLNGRGAFILNDHWRFPHLIHDWRATSDRVLRYATRAHLRCMFLSVVLISIASFALRLTNRFGLFRLRVL